MGDFSDISESILNVCASQHDGGGFEYNGDMTLGTSDYNLPTSDRLTVYGNVRIKEGGNLIIEDNDTTITQLKTDVKITDILEITNDGTGPALTVNQID